MNLISQCEILEFQVGKTRYKLNDKVRILKDNSDWQEAYILGSCENQIVFTVDKKKTERIDNNELAKNKIIKIKK
jgi:hypothetical protein